MWENQCAHDTQTKMLNKSLEAWENSQDSNKNEESYSAQWWRPSPGSNEFIQGARREDGKERNLRMIEIWANHSI